MERDLAEAIVYGSDTMRPMRLGPIQVVATGGDSLDTHFALYIFVFCNNCNYYPSVIRIAQDWSRDVKFSIIQIIS